MCRRTLIILLSAAADPEAEVRAAKERGSDEAVVVALSYDLDLPAGVAGIVSWPSEYVTPADVEGTYERALEIQRSIATARSSSGASIDEFFESGSGFGWWALTQAFPAIHLRVRFADAISRVLERERPSEVLVVSEDKTPRWQVELAADAVDRSSEGASFTERRVASAGVVAPAAAGAEPRSPAATTPREDLQRFLDENEAARQIPTAGHLVLIMRGVGRAQNRRGQQLLSDEYSEGVVDAALPRCRSQGWRLTVVYEGEAPSRESSSRGRRGEAPVVEVGTRDLRERLRRQAEWQPVGTDRIEAFLLDPAVAETARHRGIDLMSSLAPVLAAHISRLADQASRLTGWRSIFRELRPDVVLGGRLEANPLLVGAAARAEAVTVSVKLGLGEEMIPAVMAYKSDNTFDGENFPDVLVVWGEEAESLLRRSAPDMTAEIVVGGRPRNDSFVSVPTSRRLSARLLRSLGIPRRARVVVYGATSFTQYGREPGDPHGACVMSPDGYRRCLRVLTELSDVSLGDVWVVVKPHPADREELIREWISDLARPNVVFVSPRGGVHNVELLNAASLFVSSPTSMFGEAALSGVPSINLCTPDVTFFYEPGKCELFGRIAVNVHSTDELSGQAGELLASRARRDEEVARARAALPAIFGPLDGQNATRIVDAAMARAGPRVT